MFPLASDEERRLAALRALGLLDEPSVERFDRITRLALRVLEVPVALVSLIEADRQWFISCQGLDLRETPREVSFCTHAILSDEVMVVLDAREDERFRDSPLVTGDLGVRFYAGKPIRDPGGNRLGTLCVWDFQPRRWTAEDGAALTDLAALVEERLVSGPQSTPELLRLYEYTMTQTSQPIAITRPDPDPFAAEVLFANAAFCELFDFTAEELIGARFKDFPNPICASGLGDRLRTDLAAGRPCRGEASRFRKDGREIHCEWRAAPIRNGQGEISFFVWMVVDLTEHWLRERELAEARDAAERGSRVKSELLANMSHELKTPLNSVLGFSEILADGTFGDLNTRQKLYVENILESGRHLETLLTDLLDLAKIEAERLPLELAEVDAGALISDLVQSYLPVAERRGRSLSVELEVRMPEVRADPRRLHQVVRNLLDNALKFTPLGGWVRVRGGCRREGTGASWLRIAVEDSGIGVRAEDQARLFQAFEQVDTSYSRAHPGAGLGLALSRRLVEMHGGRIWVESAGEGKGSTFLFTLPLAGKEGSA
jgi:PAS domain S-box-containing protein